MALPLKAQRVPRARGVARARRKAAGSGRPRAKPREWKWRYAAQCYDDRKVQRNSGGVAKRRRRQPAPVVHTAHHLERKFASTCQPGSHHAYHHHEHQHLHQHAYQHAPSSASSVPIILKSSPYLSLDSSPSLVKQCAQRPATAGIPRAVIATQHQTPPTGMVCRTTQCSSSRMPLKSNDTSTKLQERRSNIITNAPNNPRFSNMENVGVQTTESHAIDQARTKSWLNGKGFEKTNGTSSTKFFEIDNIKKIDVILPPIPIHLSTTLESLSVESWSIYPVNTDQTDSETTNIDVETIDCEPSNVTLMESIEQINQTSITSSSSMRDTSLEENSSSMDTDEWCDSCRKEVMPTNKIISLVKSSRVPKWINTVFGYMGFNSSAS